MVTKKKKKNGMATATATIVLQWKTYDENTFDNALDALDEIHGVRRLGDPEWLKDANELRYHVVYGPLVGASEHRLRRHVRDRAIRLGASGSAVFDFRRKMVTTPDDIKATIATLEAEIADSSVALAVREKLSKTVAELRRHVTTPAPVVMEHSMEAESVVA